jgi:hypothetical protein
MVAVHLVTLLPDRLRDDDALPGLGPDDDMFAGRSSLQPLLQVEVELTGRRLGGGTDRYEKQERAGPDRAPKAPCGDNHHWEGSVSSRQHRA